MSRMIGILLSVVLMTGYLTCTGAQLDTTSPDDDNGTYSFNSTTELPDDSADSSTDPCRSITRRNYFLIGFIVPSLVLNVILIIVIVILLCCFCYSIREEQETLPEAQTNGTNDTDTTQKDASVIIQFASFRRGRSKARK